LDPFHGYKNAIDDQLADATSVLDAFHVVKLAGQAVDEVRRRAQQAIHGHRGRKYDPLYGIRNVLRCAAERLTDRQRARLMKAIEADERHLEVLVAWQCGQQLRQAYHQLDPAGGRRLATRIIESFPSCPIPEIARLGRTLKSFPSCPIPEIARLGRTLKRWRSAFLAYFDTCDANNGGTEAVNGLIELHRRIARGFKKQGKLPATDAAHRRRAHPTAARSSAMCASRDWCLMRPGSARSAGFLQDAVWKRSDPWLTGA
jgi:transposase